jgi:hypothetical protein
VTIVSKNKETSKKGKTLLRLAPTHHSIGLWLLADDQPGAGNKEPFLLWPNTTCGILFLDISIYGKGD